MCSLLNIQENERLYSQLEGLRKELKSSQAQLFHDNQQLRKELLTGRCALYLYLWLRTYSIPYTYTLYV